MGTGIDKTAQTNDGTVGRDFNVSIDALIDSGNMNQEGNE